MQIRKQTLFYLFFSFVVIFWDCEEKFKDDVTGIWGINSIEYEGVDILWDLNVNMLIFKDNGKCYLPGLTENLFD